MKTFRLVKLASFGFLFLACSKVDATAIDIYKNIRQKLATYTLDTPHWYVSGNIGVSHLYDSKISGTNDSVNENGFGWNVDGGYQWNSILGAELGYVHYYNSTEQDANVNIAKTEHYAVYLAATGRYPLVYRLSVIGKLGAAYSYANKTFTVGAGSASGAVSPYAGLGIAYSITPKVDLVAECATAFGNSYTGSSTLFSLGITFAIT